MARNYYFDNMKAFLIFMVVLGHMVLEFYAEGASPRGELGVWIYSFHMPVFLFTSGYFATTNVKKSLSLMIPLYIIFQMVQMVVRYVFVYAINPAQASWDFQLFTPKWTLWYLMAMILFSIILPIFNTDNKRKQLRNIILAIAAGLLISFTANTNNFMAINRVVTFLPFFLLGYYGKKNQGFLSWFSNVEKPETRNLVPYRILGIVGAVILTILLVVFAGNFRYQWFYGTLSYGNGYSFGMKVLIYLISFAWLAIIVFLTPRKRIPIVDKIGQNTLGIYLFHTLLIYLFKAIPIVNGTLWTSTVALIATSVVVTILLGVGPFTNILKKLRIPYTDSKKY